LALYVPMLATVALALQVRASRRRLTGALLATMWNLAGLLALNAVAIGAGWWEFNSTFGNVAGMPADLWIGWSLLWGAVPVLCPTRRLLPVVIGLVALDLIVMPLCAPVVELHGRLWLIGEVVGAVAVLSPGLVLGVTTTHDDRLVVRATLQFAAFTGLMFYVLPSLIFTVTSDAWATVLNRPRWHFVAAGVVLSPFAAAGVQAVREFTRHGGTPFPLDPPKTLATAGPYAYVANPMQIAGAVLLAGWGVLLGSVAVIAAAAVAAIFSAGFAMWNENADLIDRFGECWVGYRVQVPAWWPRWRPAVSTPATVFVAQSCAPCRSVGRFIANRSGTDLAVAAAESSPSPLTRITYRSGAIAETGVAAIGRGLEHAHLAWAIVSWIARLPGLEKVLQLIADVVSGGPRAVGGDATASAD
jgi:protein-S-isoprenylcysteine O-methyltransferase Ste14